MKVNVNPRNLSSDVLFSQCRWETFRGPGPGGQKRNKTSSSVRVVHVTTGLTATAGEFRSQERNKANAFQRLRHRLALELREPVREPVVVPEPLAAFFAEGKLRCSLRDEAYPRVLGLVIDVLEARHGIISGSAVQLKLTTANLVAFLQRDGEALAAVNRIRILAGLKPLGG